MASVHSSVRPLPPDDTRGPEILIVTWVTLSLGLIIVALRFITRGVLRRTLGRDDWTILIALAFAISQSIIAIFLVRNGHGRHIQYVQPLELQAIIKYILISIICHTIGTFFVRLSVCFFVLRLIPSTYRVFYRCIWGLMGFFALVTVANVLALCLQCIPLRGLWDFSVKAQCIPAKHTTIIVQVKGAFAAFMDVLCVALPMFFLRHLSASPRDKTLLYVMLGLGLFTAGAAVVRSALIHWDSRDLTWDTAPVALWASLEQNIGIIVASLPALRQLFMVLRQDNKDVLHSAENISRNGRLRPQSESWTEKPTGHLEGAKTTSPRESPQWSNKSPQLSSRASTMVHSEDRKRRSDLGSSWMSPPVSPQAGSREVPTGLDYGTYKCTIEGGASSAEHSKNVRA